MYEYAARKNGRLLVQISSGKKSKEVFRAPLLLALFSRHSTWLVNCSSGRAQLAFSYSIEKDLYRHCKHQINTRYKIQ